MTVCNDLVLPFATRAVGTCLFVPLDTQLMVAENLFPFGIEMVALLAVSVLKFRLM